MFVDTRSQSGSGDTDFKFTGEQLDAQSELYYLRARYYDPVPAVNLYAYVGNNPVNFTDRPGTCPGGCESRFRGPYDDCNVAQGTIGALISVTGAVFIVAPALYALLVPGAITAGSLILIEIVVAPVEIAAILIIVDSGCINFGD